MKKIILITAMLTAPFFAKAQGIDFGIKAGVNFANFSGDLNSDGITNFHAGGVLEINFVPTVSLQAEGLFTSQGGKVVYEYGGAEAVAKDVNLNYIAVPVMLKYYIIPEKLSIMAGPQFSFLIDDADEVWGDIDGDWSDEANSFDVAAAGGVELKIFLGLFAQARYTIGLNNVYDNVDSKNAVFQLSLGYMF